MALIVTKQSLFTENRMREDFPSDKAMIQMYWSLMQLSEDDANDIVVPLTALSFMNSVDVASLDSSTFY